jgi:hypothetical protein
MRSRRRGVRGRRRRPRPEEGESGAHTMLDCIDSRSIFSALRCGSGALLAVASVGFGFSQRGLGSVAHGRWSHYRGVDRGASVFEWEGACWVSQHRKGMPSCTSTIVIGNFWASHGTFSEFLRSSGELSEPASGYAGTVDASKPNEELMFGRENRRSVTE